ncbi:MAG TPA: PEGA domain-containing protein, partial [Polyangia bacterium]|nr:PEGA domain-containing protein [Polyangia bacterium]
MLLERISVGGMAEVFKAKPLQGEGGKILAIKRILPSMAEDADFIQMFIDEAKISGQLHHSNIAEIYELGRVDNSHFIAMEYVWGKDLLQMQNRFRRLRQTMKPAMAAFIASRMCQGLDYAHRKTDASGKLLGIIHRDVSPQNILVSYEGEVKVIDFGIAKAASRSTRTQAGVLKGKFGYMSPEQVRGLPLDRRSDIFAIATIIYEMLTSERLFLGESDFATLEKVRNVDVPPPSKACPACTPDLERIILKGLAREADERYQWASEMAADLETYLEQNDPTFNTAMLANWMRTQFAAEWKREGAVLEQQSKLDPKAALAVAVTGAEAAKEAPAAPAPSIWDAGADAALAAAAISPADLPTEDELQGEATQISAPMMDMVEAGGDNPGSAASNPVPLSAEATRILADGGARQGLPEQRTVILDSAVTSGASAAGGRGPSDLALHANQSTVILAAPEVPPGPHPPPAASYSMPTGAPLAAGGVPAQPMAQPVLGQALPLPVPAKKSGFTKDILIGIGVAVALIGAVLGGRAFLASRQVRSGTLVVTVSPPSVATVLLDGKESGRTTGEAVVVTLKDVSAGEHQIAVQGEQGNFSSRVTLASGDVTVVSATLRASAAPPTTDTQPSVSAGVGQLQLVLKSKEAQVLIDGAAIEEQTWSEPIPLRAGTQHELVVQQEGYTPFRLSFTLKPDEVLKREVELAPARASLSIVSEPSGAEVRINSKGVGRTPLDLKDLDPAKTLRVTISKHGLGSVTRQVSFREGLEQRLELALGGSETSAPTIKTSPAPGAATETPPAGGKKEGTPVAAVPPSTATTKPGPASPGATSKPGATPAATTKPASVPGSPTAAAVPAGEDGYLIANTQPWAKVIIDGKDTGKTTPIAPRSKIPLKPGKHTVTFVANGRNYNFDITIKAGE